MLSKLFRGPEGVDNRNHFYEWVAGAIAWMGRIVKGVGLPAPRPEGEDTQRPSCISPKLVRVPRIGRGWW